MGFDTAYEAINEDSDTHRWAYGTGFTDPLAGVDTAVSAGLDGQDLAAYCLMLGDDALIMSHRLQQWLAKAPELEEDTALANIALDLLGQARLLLSRAGAADGTGRTEDDYAFGRAESEFRNVRLAEGADADFGGLIARLLVFSTWRLALLTRLRASADPVLAAVAAQGVKELTYHRDYAAQWTIRLGDGTDYSRERMEEGLAVVAPLVGELFCATAVESRLAASGAAVDPADLRPEFDEVMQTVLATAGLPTAVVTTPVVTTAVVTTPVVTTPVVTTPVVTTPVVTTPVLAAPVLAAPVLTAAGPATAGLTTTGLADSGRDGAHTEAMGDLVAELQSVARALPGATW